VLPLGVLEKRLYGPSRGLAGGFTPGRAVKGLVQRYALDWLKAKMEYASPMRKFREALTAACKELERLEIVTAHKIEESTKGKPQLAMWLPVSV